MVGLELGLAGTRTRQLIVKATMARPREFDENQALEKALLVFWDKGYEGTSLTDLLGEMGLTKSSFYKAFGSKEDLFRRISKLYDEDYLKFEREALAETTPRAIVERLLYGAAEFQTSKRTPMGCLFSTARSLRRRMAIRSATSCANSAMPCVARFASGSKRRKRWSPAAGHEQPRCGAIRGLDHQWHGGVGERRRHSQRTSWRSSDGTSILATASDRSRSAQIQCAPCGADAAHRSAKRSLERSPAALEVVLQASRIVGPALRQIERPIDEGMAVTRHVGSTVARVLAQAGLPRIGPPARRSQVEPYRPFIHQTLEKFPTLTASRLYAMVCERGYRGSGDHFRHLIGVTGRARRRKHICVYAACPASRGKSTGGILVIS